MDLTSWEGPVPFSVGCSITGALMEEEELYGQRHLAKKKRKALSKKTKCAKHPKKKTKAEKPKTILNHLKPPRFARLSVALGLI